MGYIPEETMGLARKYSRRNSEISLVGKLVKSSLDLLFPQFCINCNKPGYSVCPNCTKKLSNELIDFPLCFICENLCIDGKPHKICGQKSYISKFISLYFYKGVTKKILQSKGRNPTLISLLLKTAVLTDLTKPPNGYDLIIPIPPSPKYLNPRLTEPTDIIAKHISRLVGTPICKALYKSPYAKQQKKLNLSKRLFPKIHIKREAIQLIKSKTILLVDDVCTSGSTLNISAKILKSYGAAEVTACTLARDLRYNKA